MRNIAAALGMLACICASAQNNPTVNVTRQYDGKMPDVQKSMISMNVPDSLMKLDLKFDYSVEDTPYKGAYEFKPYMMSMKPQPNSFSGKNLYLRAGAGYQLNPELDVVWCPEMKGRLQMSLYGFSHSFIGKYRDVKASKVKDSDDFLTLKGDRNSTYSGYDMLHRAGTSGRADWDKSSLTYDLGWYGLFTDDKLAKRAFNAADLNARMRSTDDGPDSFFYDAAIRYRYGVDSFTDASPVDKVTVNDFSFTGTFGPEFDENHKIMVDVGMDVSAYSSYLHSHVGLLTMAPHYELAVGRWDFSLGAKLDKIVRGDKTEHVKTMHEFKSQGVYPDLKASFSVIEDRLKAFASISGGDCTNSYSSQLEENHHFSVAYDLGASPLMDNSVCRMDASLGVEGSIARRLQYKLDGGLRMLDHGLLEKVVDVNGILCPTVAYGQYNMLYAEAAWLWRSKSVSIDGDLVCRYTNLPHKDYEAFSPSAFAGNIRAVYNWRGRINAGIWCEGATARKDHASYKVPGYVDLGLLAEYRLSRKLNVWLQGGNLLNQSIQRHVLYTESGINFTAGLCLSL